MTRSLSLAAALAAATGYPVWSNSVTAEVYTLAAVMSGVAIYWLIAFAQTGARRGGSMPRARCGRCRLRQSPDHRRHSAGGADLRHRQGSIGAAAARAAITAAMIGMIGVAQYGFIALRTMQGAPYLEARATTITGVFDVIIARDVSWARFYQAQSAVAAHRSADAARTALRVHMGTIPIDPRGDRDRDRRLAQELRRCC